MTAKALKAQEQDDTRGYKQITSGQLLVITVMQPWELSKTIFKDNRTNPKYSTYVKVYIVHLEKILNYGPWKKEQSVVHVNIKK